jgi:hypothetical protein
MHAIFHDSKLEEGEAYALGTISGFLPDLEARFRDVPEFAAAVRQQKFAPSYARFAIAENREASEFDKRALVSTQKLALSEILSTEELRCLNAALPDVGREVETARKAILEADPLRARMRLSAHDPPLTAQVQRANSAETENAGRVAMGVELASDVGPMSALSLKTPFIAPANNATRRLLKKPTAMDHRPSLQRGLAIANTGVLGDVFSSIGPDWPISLLHSPTRPDAARLAADDFPELRGVFSPTL